jgi:hypothetical protein
VVGLQKKSNVGLAFPPAFNYGFPIAGIGIEADAAGIGIPHSSSQSGTGAFRYRTRAPYFGASLAQLGAA